MSECKYCKKYNPNTHKCVDNRCYTMGMNSEDHEFFDEVDDKERYLRDTIYEFQEKEKNEATRIEKVTTIIRGCCITVSIVGAICLIMSLILSIMVAFEHPEFTKTQLFLYKWQHYAGLNITAIITLVTGNLVYILYKLSLNHTSAH